MTIIDKTIISIDNKEISIDGNLEDFLKPNRMKVNHGYIDNNIIYVYRGKLKSKNIIEGSIYYESYKEDLSLYGYEDENESKFSTVIVNSPSKLFKTPSGKIDKDAVLASAKLNKDKLMTPITRKLGQEDENNLDILFYQIDEDDDDIVVLLKETINSRKLSLYDAEDGGITQNLKYGLKIRKTITFSSLLKWLDALNLKVKYQITKINDEVFAVKDPAKILNFDIQANDDSMVQLIKSLATERNDITIEALATKNGNYNLYRGLTIRNAITYKSFMQWADILGYRIDIEFEENK